ncbi:hypothetical protein HIM_07540 [Hirsutella minnesotensis 3608]|uniref:Uncharacterized protein n=1 Tax=Hirsutella minnesotensis 3608 TaxID=1043627 RepID=A0A0F7ZHU9_9HYPO|nr:hypothetical protein HIM_07540 [Hirsutella minnesotensis 3608]
MGGKTWSREEELFFWRTIVPMSPKSATQSGKAVDWEQCALIMLKHFGDKARRKYTKLMLFEHYFQNITTGHKSPRATDLVTEHKRHLVAHGKGMPEMAQEPQVPVRRVTKRRSAARLSPTASANTDRPEPKLPTSNIQLPKTMGHLVNTPSKGPQAPSRQRPLPPYAYPEHHGYSELSILPPLRISSLANDANVPSYNYPEQHGYSGLSILPPLRNPPWANGTNAGYLPSSSPTPYYDAMNVLDSSAR